MSINWASSDHGARVLDCSSQIAGNEAQHVLEPNADSMWRTDNRDNHSQHKNHWICLSLINIPRNTVIRTVGWHCASAYSSNPQSVFLHVSSDGIDFKAWDRFINPRQTKGTTLFCCSAPIDTEIYPYLVLEITNTFGDVQKQDVFEKENNHHHGKSSTNTESLLDTYMEQIYVDKTALTDKSHGTYVYMNRIYLYSEEVPSSPLASLHRHGLHSPSSSSSSFSPSSSRRRPLPASPLPESYSPMPVSLSNHSSFLSPVGAMGRGRGDITGSSVQAVEWPSFSRHGESRESIERSGGLNDGSENSGSGSAGESVSDKGEGGSVRGNEGDDSCENVSALHSALGLFEEEAEEGETARRDGDDNDEEYCDEDSLDHLSNAATTTVTSKRQAEMDRAIVGSGSAFEVNTPRRENEPLPLGPTIVPPAVLSPSESPPLAVVTSHYAPGSSGSGSGTSSDTIAPMTLLPPLLIARLAYLEDQLLAAASSSSMVSSTNEGCMARLARLEEQVRGLSGTVETVRGRGKDEGGRWEEEEMNVMPITTTTTATSSTAEVAPAIVIEAPSTEAATATSSATMSEEKTVEPESQPLTGGTSEVPSEVMLLTALLHRKLSLRLLKQAQLALLQQQQQQQQQQIANQ